MENVTRRNVYVRDMIPLERFWLKPKSALNKTLNIYRNRWNLLNFKLTLYQTSVFAIKFQAINTSKESWWTFACHFHCGPAVFHLDIRDHYEIVLVNIGKKTTCNYIRLKTKSRVKRYLQYEWKTCEDCPSKFISYNMYMKMWMK